MKTPNCIIVSGPDNCGKDTLCDQLKVQLENRTGKYVVYVCPKFQAGFNNWSSNQMKLKSFTEEFVDIEDDRILLLNRSWLDEFIYGPIYRNYSETDYEWIFRFTPGFLMNSLYVYLYDEPDVLASREDGLSFSEGNKEKIIYELDRFDLLYNKLQDLSVNCSKIKSSDFKIDEMWKGLVEMV